MAIKVLRLTTNEEVLGDIKESGDSYVVSKPALLGFMADEDNESPSLVLQKYLPHSEAGEECEITISKSHVLFSFEPMEEVASHYTKVLGSGIVAPIEGIV